MDERIYGGTKPSYGVVEIEDGRIELRVYHRNKAMRKLLRQNQANPSELLSKRARFAKSHTRAEKWLADVIRDYTDHFVAGLVKIILPPMGPSDERARPALPETGAQGKKAVKRPDPGRTIVLVACVSKKDTQPMPARDLYVSDWFQKASAFAQQAGDEWYILSAKYGLVSPDAVIEPYDATLKTMPAAARREWAGRVLEELLPKLRPGDRVVILAGQAYRQHLVDSIQAEGCRVEIPMDGFRIGEQLRSLNEQLGRVRPSGEPAGRLADVRRFYRILDVLEARLGGRRVLGECDGRMRWPERGVYFFFEPGEERTTSGKGSRVVRVGTHALKAGSRSTLWGRLRQHRGTAGYGGNHRGSIFRLHVGTALIGRHRWPESMTEEWGKGFNAAREVRERERQLEKAVSWHIQHLPFLWVEVDDEPGPGSMRGYIERHAIALLSNYNHQEASIDPPSESWLGRWADREQVWRSGLWNVNHVDEAYDPGFLEVFEAAI